MRTRGAELLSEAAIYSQGTEYAGAEIAGMYNDYCLECQEKGEEPDDFQRWAERERLD